MPKSHPPYPPEYRAEAVGLVRGSGRPVAEIARRLEILLKAAAFFAKETGQTRL
jgi:transposase